MHVCNCVLGSTVYLWLPARRILAFFRGASPFGFSERIFGRTRLPDPEEEEQESEAATGPTVMSIEQHGALPVSTLCVSTTA